MSEGGMFDVAVIGGGIVGLATAMALSEDQGGERSIVVLEAEDGLAAHQTGHNSGVIHSGLYYRPGSLKALNCRSGREALIEFCREHEVPFQLCGKVVVATSEREIPAMELLAERGLANGLDGIERLDPAQVREIEPHVAAVAGLHVPQTGIVDYRDVAEAMARRIAAAGGEIRTSSRVVSCRRERNAIALETTSGAVHCRSLVACAGLHADEVARMCGVDPGVRIVPFRGEYYVLTPGAEHLVRHLIYPVPDPSLPFLGVHFTRMIAGGVEAGPNAVLSFRRDGYRRTSFSAGDTAALLADPAFWRMGARWWRTGVAEQARSLSKRLFVRSLQRLVPEITGTDIVPGGAGVRAQALAPTGALVDDFRIVEADRMVHVLNAPSPAATASISIGRYIARRATESFGAA
ncbi:MAG: L-2-hydroxyglutarate oxidase [Anaerolineae bacterium]